MEARAQPFVANIGGVLWPTNDALLRILPLNILAFQRDSIARVV